MCFRFVTDFGVIYYASRVCAIAFLSFGFIPRRVNLISLSCLRTSEMQMGYRIMRDIIRLDNPNLKSIVAEFTETIQMLSQKPE